MNRRTWNDHGGPLVDSVADFDVIECEACGFKHAVPLPSAEDEKRLYRDDYYGRVKAGYISGAASHRDWWTAVYSYRYDHFERFLPPHRRTVLDVGCGGGIFLQVGVERGWHAIGVEPAAQPAEHCRALGLKIVERLWRDINVDLVGQVDVIHMNEVLEHLPDPRAGAQLAHRLLSPGGLFCVMVPNDYNPFQETMRSLGRPPWWITPPHHLNYFDPGSLERLFTSEGFEVLVKESTFPIDIFLLFGDDYLESQPLGLLCHRKRMMLEKNLHRAGKADLLHRLYRALADVGLGREILLIGRRSDDSGNGRPR